MHTNNSTQHTPTPWHIGMKPGPFIYGERGEEIARVNSILNPDAENRANAAFIVRACNAHDELVAALENCVEIMVRAVGERLPVSIGSECEENDWLNDIKAAREALAKAKGEQ